MSWLVLFMGSLSSFAAIGVEKSTLLECYKTNETHVEVTACLDNHLSVAESSLQDTQSKLSDRMSELDNISSHGHAAVSANQAFEEFSVWRDKQCKLVEATFASGSGSGQAYLNCMIDVTNEQISRLNHLMGNKE
ncbi:lysozyme inhibitor LprI family protein [Enterovibrio nigricans]|nr:lysozyme inhibitor LprI family protein [Enterovibrio nigricans]